MEILELKENMQAPDFTLEGSDNGSHSLRDFLGKSIVLYFYSKDNTSG